MMSMTLVKITMPVKDGKLVDWEDCVIAYREKEKRNWENRLSPRERRIRHMKDKGYDRLSSRERVNVLDTAISALKAVMQNKTGVGESLKA